VPPRGTSLSPERRPLRRWLRLGVVGWWLQMKMLLWSGWGALLHAVVPLFFASAAFLIFRQSEDPQTLVFAGLGAAIMGTWSSVVSTASALLQSERSQQTLELTVSAPSPFALVLMPATCAMATVAAYSVVATLVWARVAFGIVIPIHAPVLFAVSLVVTVVAVSMFGFLLAVAVVRYRAAWTIGALLEPVGWLLCGLLFPLALLPGWVHGIAHALPPTWGVSAMRSAAAGSSPWGDIGVCVLLAIAYAAAGAIGGEAVLRSARKNAALSLS
jgi:ABC-2 type transport system permease protein